MAQPAIFLAVGVAFWLSGNASATTWDTRIPGEYYNEAEVVARVQIEEAKTLYGKLDGKPYNCGALYKARTVDALKGNGEKVEFKGYGGLSLGGEYLVFLSREPKENAWVSTNSNSQKYAAERQAACSAIRFNGLQSNDFALSEFYFCVEQGQTGDGGLGHARPRYVSTREIPGAP